ncbi:MAG: hypothetical protein AAGA57_05440 [Planctomycetota bacterium]
MANALLWCKTNPIPVICAAVSGLALLFVGYLMFLVAPGNAEANSEAVSKLQGDIKRAADARVEVPPARPGDEAEDVRAVHNQAIVEKVAALSAAVAEQADRLDAEVLLRNRGGRADRLIGTGLLPSWQDGGAPEAAAYASRDSYKRIIAAMLSGSPELAGPWPTLSTGPPMPQEQLLAVLEKDREDYIRVHGGEATDANRTNYLAQQRRLAAFKLTEHAGRIDVYAPADPAELLNYATLGTSTSGAAPQPDEIWDAQLQLWVLADVIEAVAKANADPEPDDESSGMLPVYEAPIKRLVTIEVTPGLLRGGGADTDAAPARSGGFQAGGFQPGGFGPQPASGSGQDYGPVLPAPTADFNTTPTGVVSSKRALVCQVRVVMDIDWAQAQRVFEAFQNTRRMEALSSSYTDIDEYEALQNLYLYGAGDIVRLEVVFDSVWLTDWLEPMMPPNVKQGWGLGAPAALGNARSSRRDRR